MNIEKAQKMLSEAIEAMLECGQHQAVKAVAFRSMIHGQPENVHCLVFGSSAEVCETVALRVTDSSIDERIAASISNEAIGKAAS